MEKKQLPDDKSNLSKLIYLNPAINSCSAKVFPRPKGEDKAARQFCRENVASNYAGTET